mgnify:CR=1 FL=1
MLARIFHELEKKKAKLKVVSDLDIGDADKHKYIETYRYINIYIYLSIYNCVYIYVHISLKQTNKTCLLHLFVTHGNDGRYIYTQFWSPFIAV